MRKECTRAFDRKKRKLSKKRRVEDGVGRERMERCGDFREERGGGAEVLKY